MKTKRTILLGMSILALAGCQNMSSGNTSDANHFEYDHQEKWKQDSGKMQSPIDIVSRRAVPLDTKKESGKLEIRYNNTVSNITNNGHSVQVTDAGVAYINGRGFSLQQFHFHAPSEHTIDGKHYPMEVHFVNREQDGRLAVIAVFFEIGKANDAFDSVLHNIDKQKSSILINIKQLIPSNTSYYHYLGSLTTPPLTENVEWYVMKNPVQISAEQVAAFKELYPHNNREIQALNDRVIVSYDVA